MRASRGAGILERRIAELEGALERARHASEVLRRVSTAVGTTAVLDELLGLIVDATTEVLAADRATLYLRKNNRLVSRVKIGDELTTISVALGQGIAGHVAKTGKPLRVADAYRDRRFDRTWDQKSGYRSRSILAVPLVGEGGKTVGVLQVLNKLGPGGEPQLFTHYDRELLQALAAQAVISIDKASMFAKMRHATERLERTLRDLGLLYELETAMSRADSVSELAGRVLVRVGKACQAAAGALLHAAEDGQLTLFVVNRARPKVVRAVVVRPGEGICGRAMALGRLISIDEPRRVRDPARVRELLGMDVRSAIAAPLGGTGHPIAGAIACYNHRGATGRFSEDDTYLLRLVSANVSTELRLMQARKQRERARRLESIGELLSGVLHDLRTPLTVIGGYVQLMQTSNDPDRRAAHGRTIAEQFDIIAAMQRDVLAYARGETTMLVRKVLLGRLLEGIERHHRAVAAAAAVALKLGPEETGVAFIDEGKITRALNNLVQNALEAMPDGGTVTLACRRTGDDLSISVADTGPGIPAAIRRRLFQPFVTAGKRTGTGLGLANVKQIVAEHGGRIEVESSRRGTCFTVTLPQAMLPVGLRRDARTR